jgi:hypothetical protein
MTNPFEAFRVDDDEDNEVVVQSQDKPKRSSDLLIQLIKKRKISKNNKKRAKKMLLLHLLPLSLTNQFLRKQKISSPTLICKEPKKIGNKRMSHQVTLSIVEVELEESKYFFIKRSSQESSRRLRKRWKY